MIQKSAKTTIFLLLAIASSTSAADNDARQLVQMPKMMQEHMMSNMRDHLAAINEILLSMGNGDLVFCLIS